MVLSERTVGAHVRRLLVKLDIADTEDANRRVLAVLLNAMAVTKMLWGVSAGDGTGWAMTAPALFGLLVGDAVILFAVRRRPYNHANRVAAGSGS